MHIHFPWIASKGGLFLKKFWQKPWGYAALFSLLCFLFALAWPEPESSFLPTGNQEGVDVPVAMYHHVLEEDSSLLGDYVISRQELESDLQWLQKAGYTPVSPDQLIAYAAGEGELPQNPILLTFDDGYESFFANAYPLLQKYQMPAVVSVIGRYSDLYSQPDAVRHLNYSHLDWDQVKTLSQSPYVSIGSHSYNMHDAAGQESRSGAKKLPGETNEHYAQVFTADTQKIHEAITDATGKEPTLYAYPFGFYTAQSEEILKSLGYQITLSCESRVSRITRDPSSLFLLGRFNRPHGLSSQDFFARMQLEATEGV